MKMKWIIALLTAALLVTAVPVSASADTAPAGATAEAAETTAVGDASAASTSGGSTEAADKTASVDTAAQAGSDENKSAAASSESVGSESSDAESTAAESGDASAESGASSSSESEAAGSDLASKIAEAKQGVAEGDPEAQRVLDELEAEVSGLVGARCDTLGGAGLQHSSEHAGMQKRYGVDVSKWDGNIDWARLKAEGVTFAFIRLGYRSSGNGAILPDRTGITNLRNAIANGIPVGVYIFSQAVSTDEAKEEADALANWASGYNISLPYVMDYEYANGRLSRSVPVSTKTACVNAFTAEMKRLGHTPALYADADYLHDDLTASQISSDCTIWMAHWDMNPKYTGSYTFWQYSSHGQQAGVSSTYVDLDVWYYEDPIVPGTVSVTPVTENEEYTATLSGASIPNLANLYFAVWSEENGQDDLLWLKASGANGTYTRDIDLDDFSGYGTYNVHCYAQQTNGKVTLLGTTTFTVAKPETQTVSMYRLYNPNSGEHFYTANLSERDSLVKAGWKYEGIGWKAPTSGSPIYRLYNPNSGDHHYTGSTDERDDLVKRGWRYEDVSFYSALSGEPQYRLYNPNCKGAGAHHYTGSAEERDGLVTKGWRYEGIAWYGA
ncbi:MAG: GH25 family lysozyme [Eubacteriales bacterium]|jgi:GH25 family lysozyme M1 (1,4-beta-N-acetylmuramidase)